MRDDKSALAYKLPVTKGFQVRCGAARRIAVRGGGGRAGWGGAGAPLLHFLWLPSLWGTAAVPHCHSPQLASLPPCSFLTLSAACLTD